MSAAGIGRGTMRERKESGAAAPLSATDYHILMVLAEADLYGYAIMKAVEEDSRGAVSPGIGSLYRILARLTTQGWAEEAPAPKEAPTEHRGHPRQYYRLTRAGRAALGNESRRLESVLQLARERKLLTGGSR
jgi:DNA-binding PadR family transcriptional regulator